MKRKGNVILMDIPIDEHYHMMKMELLKIKQKSEIVFPALKSDSTFFEADIKNTIVNKIFTPLNQKIFKLKKEVES